MLVVSAPDLQAAESFKIGSNGSLTDLGFVAFANVTSCANEGCLSCRPRFHEGQQNRGLRQCYGSAKRVDGESQHEWRPEESAALDLPDSPNLVFSNAVFLSAGAYAGSGFLYVGMVGGVVTATFTESPLSITATNATPIPAYYSGGLASTGDTLVLTEPPQDLGTFKINSDGSLTHLSTVKDTAGDPIWPKIYPNTR